MRKSSEKLPGLIRKKKKELGHNGIILENKVILAHFFPEVDTTIIIIIIAKTSRK